MSQRKHAESRAASFRHALAGWAHVLRSQPNAWIHALMTSLAVGMGLFFGLSRLEWLMLLLTVTLVWLAEFFNTALEALVDLASPDPHPLAGTAKDVAAAAVLVSACAATLVGLILFGPPILQLLRGG